MVGATVILLFAYAAISNGQGLVAFDDFGISSIGNDVCNLDWSFNRCASNGPYCWHTFYEKCDGSNQSPINIETDKVNYGDFKPLYDDVSKGLNGNLSHHGYAPMFTVYNSEQSYNLYQIPSRPKKTFRLEQFHMHFHKKKGKGSEHRINCKGYDGELHFVHFENGLASRASITHKNVVVLATFVKKGGQTHKSLLPFFQNLKSVSKCGSHINLRLNGLTFLKDLGDLYTYEGSLTTPDCSEGVTWLIKRKPLTVSEDDFEKLELLMWGRDAYIIGHGSVRPPFPMKSRQVLANFKVPNGANNDNHGNNDDDDQNKCTKWYYMNFSKLCGNHRDYDNNACPFRE